MTLAALRTYLAVVRTGSLSAAAKEMGYTQSAVSRQVAALERHLGVLLLAREARGARPTPAGLAFAAHAQLIVAEIERARRAAHAASTHQHLSVGATPSIAAGILPRAIKRVRSRKPEATWTLVTALSVELERRVSEEGLDLAVVVDTGSFPTRRGSASRRLLGTDLMCVIVPNDHRLSSVQRPIDISELASDPWVEDDEGSARLLRLAAARAGFEPQLALWAGDLTGKTALVAAGEAVALVPGIFRPALRTDVTALDLLTPPTRGVYALSMTVRDDAQYSPMQELLLELTEAFQDQPEAGQPSTEN